MQDYMLISQGLAIAVFFVSHLINIDITVQVKSIVMAV